MAEPESESNNQEEHTFPSKRKTHQQQQDTHNLPNKSPKLTITSDHNHSDESELPTTVDSSSNPDAVPKKESGNDDNKEPENEIDEEDDDEDEDEEDEEEDSDGERVVDRKGKGILRDDKGKGKMVEEDEENEDSDDDDSDDSDDDSDANVSGSDSDFSDDPLAEVDLNNILPSRTRRRTTQPGLHISDKGNDDRDA